MNICQCWTKFCGDRVLKFVQSWFWHLKSLKVTSNCTTELVIYDFLLVFNSNYRSISNGCLSVEWKEVLTEISLEMHNVSATIIPINTRDGTYLKITFMKYDGYWVWQRIFSLNACSIFSLIFFFLQNPVKSRSTQKSSLACPIT